MIVFTGGGTGGHLYPAIAIADALRERVQENVENDKAADFLEIIFIGTADRLEATIVPKSGYRLKTIAAQPFLGASFVARIRAAYVNAVGVVRSIAFLRRVHPDIVIATGGYVCFPVVAAARILRILHLLNTPIALLEPNAQPGLTSRILTPLVDEIWCAYETSVPGSPSVTAGDSVLGSSHHVTSSGTREARGVEMRAESQRFIYTGVPVRASLENAKAISKEDARVSLGLDRERRVLLVMGGSQGARSVNDAIVGVVSKHLLPAGWQVLLIAGARNFEDVTDAVSSASSSVAKGLASQEIRVVGYLDDMAEAYSAADLVLARAGSSTLAELEAFRIPAILVPLPAAENHQEANARAFARSGAAVVVSDSELGGLAGVLQQVMVPERLAAMQAAFPAGAGGAVSRILARIDGLLSRKNA
jgi:UDP-N-acetylglucosamine--N-acetylmuramyl-(pentapeptide) pyrophosphoryl-undecaprenol N-acetylglucosamine transferase